MESEDVMAPALPQPTECWSPTDQIIIEHLLFPLDAADSPCDGGGFLDMQSRPAEPVSLATITGLAIAQSSLPSPRRSAELMRLTSEEERKQRHRVAQQRFMQRKKDTITRIKQQVHVLEQKYRVLETQAETQQLTDERNQLGARLLRAATAPECPPQAHIHAMVEDAIEQARVHYEPLDEATWTGMFDNHMRDFDVWMHDPDYLSTGLTVMGWKDQRKVNSNTLRYVFSKEFAHEDAVKMWNTTYDSLVNPATHASCFNPAFTIKVQVLQQINKDQTVLHRVMYSPQTRSAVHLIELLSRVRRGDQYLVYGQALTNSSLHIKFGSSWLWSHATVWLSFTPLGDNRDEGCLVRMGGHLRMLEATSIAYWMMEVFFMALRYESCMVAPIFSLTGE